MKTRGSARFQTRTNRRIGWLAAVLALSMLAVSCSGPGDEDDAAAPAVADVGGDRADSGSETYAAATTAAPGRTVDAEPAPMVEEEPMAEEAADYAEAAAAEAEAALQAAQAEGSAAAAEAEAELEAAADASTSGVSRTEAADSDRSRPEEARRRCPECQANTFEDYGVNPFVDTYEDNLSTFALDVDTASYVVTRNYLEGGQLPPIGAVRVEEFVNYFDGGYQTLIDEFNVTLEAAPPRSAIPTG